MLTRHTLPLALTILSSLAAMACGPGRMATADTETPTLAGAPLAHWVEVLEPAPEERAWLEIPWHVSFHSGLEAADRDDRPLLLWLMNGHPLGCT